MAVATRWPLVGRREEVDAFRRAFTDAGCEGFCIYGPPGVGKSRLADECLEIARVAGRRALRATADLSTEAMPFGAVAHLMPARALDGLAVDVLDPISFVKLYDAARRVLTPTEDESGVPVLLLDDAHTLDAASFVLVDRLVDQRKLFCIATVRTGDSVPEILTRWWRNERAARIDVAELDEVDVDTLLHIALEGPLDSAAASDLWRASRGNVLALRELVLGAQADGVLVRRDGVWTLGGELRAAPRLRELIEGRITRLDPVAREVLERLALCQPLSLGELEVGAGLTVLEGLERDGLISVISDGRRESVRLAHPLHGEVLRVHVPALRRRSILLAAADAVERVGTRRREDPIRVATWRLEATGRADPDLLVLAACLARYDHHFGRAAELARAALVEAPTATAGLVLGEALYNLGSFGEAERVLADATESAVGDHLIVRIATVRRRNLFRGLRRDADAVDVAHAAMARVSSPASRDELAAGEAEVLAIAGRPLDALALLDAVDATSIRLGVLAAIPRSISLAVLGRCTEAIAVSAQASRDHAALGDELGIPAPGTHRVNQLFAMVHAGSLDAADEAGRMWFEDAVRARRPLGVIWLGTHLARCALVRGRPVSALEWTARVRGAIDTSGFEGLRPATNAVDAVAHALLGNASASAACADLVEGATFAFGFTAVELPLARAWASIAGADLPAARDVLLAGADAAERVGHLPVAAWLLHDAARIGGAADAAARLVVLASRCDSALMTARARHASALVAGDATQLVEASDHFEALGARLLAAEAAAAAADESRRRHEQRRATALDVRATALLDACEGARTPLLARGGGVTPLTGREREIAMLAASGEPSRVIAERLYLSVRTVNNHLGRIYDKLGVASRAELATALDRDRTEP